MGPSPSFHTSPVCLNRQAFHGSRRGFPAWIGFQNNLVDAALIKSLIAIVAFKNLQVRTERSFASEPLCRILGDQSVDEEWFNPLFRDRPHLALCERLSKIRQIGEGLHRGNPDVLQLTARGVEIELAFQVMHTGLEERLSMQPAPEPDRAEFVTRRQWLVCKVSKHFVRSQVDIGKDDDAAIRLFEHLGSPAGGLSRVESFAADEAQLLQDRHERCECFAAGSVRVMVMIGPAKAEAILPRFLNAGGTVSRLPVLAFALKEQVAGAATPRSSTARAINRLACSKPSRDDSKYR